MLVRITCTVVSFVEKQHRKWGGKGKRFEPWYNVENDKEKSGEEIWDFIFS